MPRQPPLRLEPRQPLAQMHHDEQRRNLVGVQPGLKMHPGSGSVPPEALNLQLEAGQGRPDRQLDRLLVHDDDLNLMRWPSTADGRSAGHEPGGGRTQERG